MSSKRLIKIASLTLACALLAFCSQKVALGASDVLIVADEMPQMELLIKILKARASTSAALMKQADMPTDISKYRAVFVFVHGVLEESAEKPLVDYANGGGRLILLHHSISQGKGKNRYWFPFLGMRLTPGDPEKGLYKWINPVTYTVVNLAPGNYITSHKVRYPAKVQYKSSDLGTPEREYPAFTLQNSEVFLNHAFTDGKEKTILLGFKWQDPRTGKVWMQDRAGWYKEAGKGWVIYLQPGHGVTDIQNSTYAQIVLNALDAKLTHGKRAR